MKAMEVGLFQEMPMLLSKKRCPSCSTECPVAVKKCRHSDCNFTFTKKKKDWERILSRGQTSSTHEFEKLQYRADVLYAHHNYEVVVLAHHKHGGGHNIHRYGTPGVAFDFIGSSSSKQPPSTEGRLFLNLFASFCRANQRPVQKIEEPQAASQGLKGEEVDKTCNIMKEPQERTSRQQSQDPPSAKTSNKGNTIQELRESISRPKPQVLPSAKTSKKGSTIQEPQERTPRQQPQDPPSVKTSNKGNTMKEPQERTSRKRPQDPASGNTIKEPQESTLRQQPQDPASVKTSKVKTVVLYRLDGIDLAVGFHQPERRTLHGKALPPGCDVVQLTWVSQPDTPAPHIMGDQEENATLSAGQFFALPRTNLVKVVASN